MKKLAQHIINGFTNSYNGLKRAWVSQYAFRMECIVLFIACPLAWYLQHNVLEFILLLSSVLLLLIAELFNSAIETVTDRIGFEYHKLSGIAKDLASSGVFCTIIYTIFVWVSIIISHYTHKVA